jgi:hemin uptake protein HemP
MEGRDETTGAAVRTVPDVTPPLPPEDQAVARPQLNSQELLQGHRMVEIRHNDEVYRLQATRLGKLILTK